MHKIEIQIEKLNLKLMRKARKMGVKKFCAKTGLHQSDVSCWINSKKKWSYNKIFKIYHRLEDGN